MSSKIKNASFLIISMIIFTLIILWCKQTLALAPGQTFYLTANSDYLIDIRIEYNLASATSNFFCIQEDQPLNHNTKFTVSKVGNGDGFAHFTVTPSAHTEKNYVMARIAEMENTKSSPENRSYSAKQKAIYGYFSTWADAYKNGWEQVTVNGGGITDEEIINDAKTAYKNLVKSKRWY